MTRDHFGLSVLVWMAVAGNVSAAPLVPNSSFETPDLGNGPLSYQYAVPVANQGGSGFTFNDGAGIAAVGSNFDVPSATHGDQVMFLQAFNVPGFLWFGDAQAPVDFSPAGLFTVSFDAIARNGQAANAAAFSVSVGATTLTFSGSTTVLPGATYTHYTSDPFAAAGVQQLRFRAHEVPLVNDLTSFVDLVTVAVVPEPAGMLCAAAALGLFAIHRRGRRGRREGGAAAVVTAGLLAIPNVADAVPVEWPVAAGGNGHFYDRITTARTWTAARDAAAASTFGAVNGHLVTITSAAENQFITNAFGAANIDVHWIGLFQQPGAPEPAGGWTWVTGEPLSFLGWFPGEPNNLSGNENAAAFAHPVQSFGKPWNDTQNGEVLPYVVEYPVPEPATPAVALVVGARGMLRRSRC